MDITLELVENIFEFRSLQKLEDPLYCEKFLFFLSHSLSEINELDTPAETYLDKIVQTLREATDRYFPLRQLKRREPKKTWITNRIKRHIAIKDKLYQLWLKTKSEEHYEKYKKKRNEVNMEIKIAKRNDVQFKIDRSSPKESFRYIKSMKGENSQVKISSKLSADDFNNYFITACDQQKVIQVTGKCIYDQGYQPQTLFFYRVTEIEIANLIATLNNIPAKAEILKTKIL